MIQLPSLSLIHTSLSLCKVGLWKLVMSSVQDKCDIPITPKTSKLQWVRNHRSEPNTFLFDQRDSLEVEVVFGDLTPTSSYLSFGPTNSFHPSSGRRCLRRGWTFWHWRMDYHCQRQVVWFSEQFTMTELRHWKPRLDKRRPEIHFRVWNSGAISTSHYCYGTHPCHRICRLPFPTSSDNTSAESSINRQLSTKEPSATFLQFISQWALQRNVALSVSHIAGRDNSWADDLSRNRLQQWKAYPRFRLSLSTFFSIGRVVKLFPTSRPSAMVASIGKKADLLPQASAFFFITHRQASLPICFLRIVTWIHWRAEARPSQFLFGGEWYGRRAEKVQGIGEMCSV